MWDWLQGLSGGAASFIGSLTGSAIGLIALLIGALFNAHLNRKRDDRLRNDERRSVAEALLAELEGLNRTLIENADKLKVGVAPPDFVKSIRVLPHMLPKIGLLDMRSIRATLDAYIVIEQYAEFLVAVTTTLTHTDAFAQQGKALFISPDLVKGVMALNENTVTTVRKAIERLNTVTREES